MEAISWPDVIRGLIGGIAIMLGLTGWWGWRYRELKRRVKALEDRREPENQPERVEFRNEYSIAYWTDPKDGERKQLWIPRVWLEYENGATKMLEIDGLVENQNMTLFPLGPVSYREKDGG